MGHPIWDQPAFRLGLAEARIAHEELTNAFTDPEEVKQLAQEAGVAGFELSGVVSTLWLNMLRRAAEQKRLPTLVARVRARSLPPALTKALDAVDKVKDLGGSLYAHRKLLEGPRVFLGRPTLRKHLPKMQGMATNASILVVRGPTQTGRSETQHLLFDQNADLAVFVDQLVPLKETMGYIWTQAAETAPQPQSHTTEAASFITFWNDVQSALDRKNLRMWVLLDDLDKGAQRDDVTLLGETLAKRMTAAPFQKRFRLVLLGYPKPTLDAGMTTLEDVTEPLKETDVRDFVDYCCAVRGKNVAVTQVESIATELFAAASSKVGPGISVGRALNDRLLDWYEDFFV